MRGEQIAWNVDIDCRANSGEGLKAHPERRVSITGTLWLITTGI